jgi:hypothetical protein
MTDYQSIKLISIYFTISDLYDLELKYHCQRFSNNNTFDLSDIELITIYIYAMNEEERFSIKQIYKFTRNHLLSWFPKLPSYVAFNTRLNNLASVFQHLTYLILHKHQLKNCNINTKLLDSLPIITCSGKRTGKVAREITDKGYCSTKNMYYFGLKLHLLASRIPNKIPYPESIVISPASENDLNIFKQDWSFYYNTIFYGDKIYFDIEYFKTLYENQNITMLTPVKAIKGQAECLKQVDKAFNDLFSKAVSKIRQPIESFFNWLIQKTDIQRASKVRSTKGLIVHVFGRIAAALFCLNP